MVLLFFTLIGPENSHHPHDQSDAKLKPITTWSPAFSRALSSLFSLILSSHWLLKVFYSPLIGRCGNLSFGLTTQTEKRSNNKTLLTSLMYLKNCKTVKLYITSTFECVQQYLKQIIKQTSLIKNGKS